MDSPISRPLPKVHTTSRICACAKRVLWLCWMNLCSSDGRHGAKTLGHDATIPQCLINYS